MKEGVVRLRRIPAPRLPASASRVGEDEMLPRPLSDRILKPRKSEAAKHAFGHHLVILEPPSGKAVGVVQTMFLGSLEIAQDDEATLATDLGLYCCDENSW